MRLRQKDFFWKENILSFCKKVVLLHPQFVGDSLLLMTQ